MSDSPPRLQQSRPSSITLMIGQAVHWPPAPMGIAQICDLMRTRVRICYPCKNGIVRQPVVRVSAIAAAPPLLFPLHNVFNRGVLPRSKTYPVTRSSR